MSSSAQPIKVVFGTAGGYYSADTAAEIYSTLQKHGVDNLDTAQLYGNAEEVVGSTDAAAKGFTIDTKDFCGFYEMAGQKPATKEVVIERGEESFKKLKTKKIDILYLHAPDRSTPLTSTLSGVNELYKRGYFSRFGLSNFKADEVATVIKTCQENGFVVPSVYQGNYNPVSRLIEEDLFPLLRKHNIAFYAYSPLAGGFLTKTKADIESKSKGRFVDNSTVGSIYMSLYNKPSFLNALDMWEAISKEYDIGKAELAYRWVAYNSPLKRKNGDAIIIGGRTLEQLEGSLKWFEKGPLPEGAVKGIQSVWDSVKGDAGWDNFNLNK